MPGSFRPLLAIACVLMASAAHADGPLVAGWVELRVTGCQAVTFEAPEKNYGAYVTGESHRTTLVTGYVTGSGMRGDYGTAENREQNAAEFLSLQPKQNARLNLVLLRWSPAFCRANQDKVVRFNYHNGCDTLPLRGSCMPPMRLAVPSACDGEVLQEPLPEACR